MKDEYIPIMYDIVQDTSQTTGVQLPVDVEHYIVALLAYHVDRPDFFPKTLAESYLTINNYRDAKTLGDTCLFVAGIFPDYKLNSKYVSDVGKSSYIHVSESLHNELFKTLGIHFDYLSKFLNSIQDKNSLRTNFF